VVAPVLIVPPAVIALGGPTSFLVGIVEQLCAGQRFSAQESETNINLARDLEGIVAKRKLGIYKDDAPAWLKLKNPTYSQAEGRHELLTRGR